MDEERLEPPLRGVVEVEWDGWDEPRRRARAVWVVAVLLVVAVAVVAALVVRAVNTDAELPTDTTTTEVAPGG
jgi:hypothetical protein